MLSINEDSKNVLVETRKVDAPSQFAKISSEEDATDPFSKCSSMEVDIT